MLCKSLHYLGICHDHVPILCSRTQLEGNYLIWRSQTGSYIEEELWAERHLSVIESTFGRLADCGRFGDPTGFTTGLILTEASR